jgi:hypothetical protein
MPADDPPGGYTFSADFRGETLTYAEADRAVEMEWYWARGYSIVASSIRTWRYDDGRTAPVTPESGPWWSTGPSATLGTGRASP